MQEKDILEHTLSINFINIIILWLIIVPWQYLKHFEQFSVITCNPWPFNLLFRSMPQATTTATTPQFGGGMQQRNIWERPFGSPMITPNLTGGGID
jgi:hypothetical protein